MTDSPLTPALSQVERGQEAPLPRAGAGGRGRRARVAVLISGRGSNLLALLQAIECGEVAAEIVLVVSNRAEAAGLAHARSRAIATLTADRSRYPKRADRQQRILAALVAADVDLVVCAGFDEILRKRRRIGVVRVP